MLNVQFSMLNLNFLRFRIFLRRANTFCNDRNQLFCLFKNTLEFPHGSYQFFFMIIFKAVLHSLSSFKTTPILWIKSFRDSDAYTSPYLKVGK